ncbi:MAG TPA: class I SAM-dependent RNA methyltransferase [Candidatus Omnitrophota bacterium]|nr:class I SAM-dependent RNA methyltransferase [Candidatus Omnitrophota bacterium]HPS21176.1 class I SAM-dependent RNA methyltransferase [Candidatus Omnitrophota bacterium]
MKLHGINKILITCARGIAPFLAEEVKALGYVVESSHETGVVITGEFIDTYKLNLNLRTAYNVLFLLKQFRCASADDLYKKTFDFAWENIIPEGEYISVVSQVNNPTIRNSMFANQKLKDAIADRMVRKTGSRPDAGPERKNIVIHLYWKDKEAWMYLNTSGNKLADRGYRKIPLIAPMQETLAAACLLAAGYTGKEHLVNPMCGSGTIAIEAALIALNKAPGLLRSNYALTHLKNFDKEYWQSLRKDTLALARKKTDLRIIATDISPKAIDAAIKNAKTCGVDHLIEFKACDFAETDIPEGSGIVLLNPEYGERMGDEEKLVPVYKNIGDFFKKRCQGYTGYVFTGNLELAKKVHLHASRRIPLYNGDIDCRLLKYEMY